MIKMWVMQLGCDVYNTACNMVVASLMDIIFHSYMEDTGRSKGVVNMRGLGNFIVQRKHKDLWYICILIDGEYGWYITIT